MYEVIDSKSRLVLDKLSYKSYDMRYRYMHADPRAPARIPGPRCGSPGSPPRGGSEKPLLCLAGHVLWTTILESVPYQSLQHAGAK